LSIVNWLWYNRAMKVLVTGGCGFIGSHVVDAYVEKGYETVIVDNLSTGKRENWNRKAKLYVANICGGEMEAIFREEKPDLVNHHAAQISVPLSVQEPLLDAEVNIKGTINLLELARKNGTKRFIFASTGGAIYGEAEKVPTDEDYLPEPASPYAISKFAGERYIRYYYGAHRLDYTILRYSNVYGPRQIPHGEAGVVAIFSEKFLRGEKPTLNHFPDEPRGMVRDYCFVKDIARASMLSTEKGERGVFNIGTGKGTHTLELYRLILTAMRDKGVAVPADFDEPNHDFARPGDIKISILDAGRAMRHLGWMPSCDLAGGLSETVEWYRTK
jgi:UDP-glucose 4-epimerase